MIKLRVLNAFISRHGRYFKPSEYFHIDGYELVGCLNGREIEDYAFEWRLDNENKNE